MRPTGRLLPIVAAALLAGACSSGNQPAPPSVVQAGWSWDPAVAGGHPLPVTWQDAGAPRALPLLPTGDCAASGSAHALAVLASAPLVAGISVSCTGGVPTMRPVTWQGGAVTALPIPAGDTQGTALAAGVLGDVVYAAGATGNAFPRPALWRNGVLTTPFLGELLPPWADSGVITSLEVTSKYVLAAGVIHWTASNPPVDPLVDPPVYQGVIWVLDTYLTSVTITPLAPPGTMGADSFGGGVSTTTDGLKVYSAGALVLAGREKPMFWLDTDAYPISGSDYTTGPWGVPTDISLVDVTPYVTGFFRSPDLGSAPQPVIWTPNATQPLPTAGATPTGSGEAIATAWSWAFVGGETLAPDPSRPSRSISVPALWVNAGRTDLPALVAPGGGPLVDAPLFGWWKVPGYLVEPDWPYPGGFGQVLRSADVAAAGSAVARALVTIP